jgi:crossover junction endodeoxyribonuclease RuvC
MPREPSPIVLGVDPGTIVTGWGVVQRQGARLHGVAAGVIRAGNEPDLPARLKRIYAELVRVVEQFQPTAMAVEDLFFARSASAALKLGHARGVALLAGANANLEIFAYPPALVKRSVAGRGHAAKEQVARMIGAILGWRELPAVDATDALAVAITHLNAVHFVGLAPRLSRPQKVSVRHTRAKFDKLTEPRD